MHGAICRAAVVVLALALGGRAEAKGWKLVTRAGAGSAQEARSGYGLLIAAFRNERHGLAVFGAGQMYFTQNGGKKWQKARFPAGVAYPDGIDIVNEKVAFACAGVQLRRSDDGGKTWRALPDITTGGAAGRSLSFATEKSGWLAVLNGLINTYDGGKTWNAISLPREVTDDVVAVHRQHDAGYLLLNKGILFRTTNGGQGWEAISLPTTRKPIGLIPASAIEAVRFKDSSHGVVVLFGEAPERGFYVLETADGGKNWFEEPVPAELQKTVGNIYLSNDGRYLTVNDVNKSRVLVFKHDW